MPLRPNLIEQLLFLSTAAAPGPLFELLGVLGFKAVVSGLRLGVFEALGSQALELDELARRTACSRRGLGFLLEALEALGYVTRAGDRFANTAMTRRWLLASAEQSMAELFFYFDDMAARWEKLDEAVRLGGPAIELAAWNEARPGGWRRYHAGMRAIARLLAPEVTARVKLNPAARRLLDLGGSHGLFSTRFCRRYPELSAIVLDGPAAREIAEETIAAEGMGGRVLYRTGDFLTGELGQGWDVVLLFSVARVLPREVLIALLRRIAAALAPGGQLVVLDQLAERPSTKFRRANARLVELELFGATQGEIHSALDLTRWLGESGFGPPRRIRLRRAGGQELLVASRG